MSDSVLPPTPSLARPPAAPVHENTPDAAGALATAARVVANPISDTSHSRFSAIADLWKRLRPRSFRGLLIVGFTAVAIPLVGALLATSYEVDRLAQQSHQAINRAVEATRWARLVVEEVDASERAARQFQVLKETALWQAYEAQQAQLLLNTAQLATHFPEGAVEISQLESLSNRIRAQLSANPDTLTSAQLARRFAEVARQARSLYDASNSVASTEATIMRQRAVRTRTLLFWQAFAIIAVAVALSWYFLRAIASPVRRIDAAVRALGDGKLDDAIEVTGPQDFVELGQRLDWLRVRLGELDEQKSRFLRHVSHELKTPMSAIREGSNLLLEEVPGPLTSPQREVAEIVRDNARRLEHLIEDLLGITRLPAGTNFHDDWRVLRLDEVLDQVVKQHSLSLAAKTLALTVNVVPVHVRGSASALTTLIDNLISNAIKYSPDKGAIRVGLSVSNERAILEVQDEGPGIPGDEKEAIFSPFFRGRKTQFVKGTGLGLTIAKEAATAHGGDIVVVDTADKGALLRISLPLFLDASGTPSSALATPTP